MADFKLTLREDSAFVLRDEHDKVKAELEKACGLLKRWLHTEHSWLSHELADETREVLQMDLLGEGG